VLRKRLGIALKPLDRPDTARQFSGLAGQRNACPLLESPRTLHHRVLLATLYGAGLRVSEVTQVKVSDIDAPRSVLWVRHGKGRRDRQTLLSPKLLELLRDYWRADRPANWLFPNTAGTRPIGPKAVFLACRSAARLAGILKRFIRTPCGTPLSPICSKPGPICVPSRSCSVTPTWKPPRATYMSPTWPYAPRPVRSILSIWISYPPSREPASARDGRYHPHPSQSPCPICEFGHLLVIEWIAVVSMTIPDTS